MKERRLIEVLGSGVAQAITLKVVNQNGHVRVLMERAGHTDGGQKMLFEIFESGKKGKILQTARDGFGNFVQQRPGQSKNNIYDVKRWEKP